MFVGLLTSITISMFPFVLLVLNLVAWVTLGAVFVVLSGVAISVAKPLFHLIKDSINQRKIEKEEGQDREKVVDGNEKRSANANVEIESPRSLLNDVEVSRQKLLLSSKNFVSETIKGNYKCWLFDDEINDIAEKQYGYPDSDNGVMFTTWSLYIIKETVPNSSKEIRKRIERLDEDFFHWYREGIKETGGLDRPIYTLILGLKDHWVTLTIAYDNESKRFRAYYCNSFGGIYNRIDRELLDCLEEGKFFSLRKEDIRVSKTRQQKDGCNCGIYALENAKIITEMMKESRSFDEIDEKLAEYVHADEKQEEKRLQVKRKEFARVLINDMSHMSDSDFKQKIEGYERT